MNKSRHSRLLMLILCGLLTAAAVVAYVAGQFEPGAWGGRAVALGWLAALLIDRYTQAPRAFSWRPVAVNSAVYIVTLTVGVILVVALHGVGVSLSLLTASDVEFLLVILMIAVLALYSIPARAEPSSR